MDKNQGPISWLKKLLIKENKPDKKTGKYHYLILVLCIGAACMLVGNMLFKTDSTASVIPTLKNQQANSSDVPAFGMKNNSSNKTIADYEQEYENQLKKAIEDMLGVNNVTVVVNIDSTDKQVLEKNKNTKSQTTEETDQSGGHRKVQDSSSDEQVVITRSGDKEVPIVLETKKPEIRGVLIVAKGAENIQVKQMIVEAVTRALDVPSYKVAVTPMFKK